MLSPFRIPPILKAFATLALLSACGFTPIYDSGEAGGAGRLADIEITPIPDRLGQLVRSRLRERIEETAEPAYQLDIVLQLDTFQFGLRGDDPTTGATGDAAATQEQVSLMAQFKLIDINSGEAVMEETATARSSFDLVLSDFAIVAQREDTSKRLALELVERIERRLYLYLKGLNR